MIITAISEWEITRKDFTCVNNYITYTTPNPWRSRKADVGCVRINGNENRKQTICVHTHTYTFICRFYYC